MAQKTFRETLIEELVEAGSPTTARTVPPPAPVIAHHRPVYISGHSTNGRLKCSSCDVPLCLGVSLHVLRPPPTIISSAPGRNGPAPRLALAHELTDSILSPGRRRRQSRAGLHRGD
ncbi:unnamed protein product [Pleuronectes platessa]|uniref:Uncharacterized protein n=1 Tax=Pleuronectes platessa TaxID=8262 RepID=A0A9N7UMH1_PLEPL|nr:unnamed protein product [Pleuronectes platessa]